MRLSLVAVFTCLAAASLSASLHAQENVTVAPFTSVALKGGGHVLLRYGAVQRVTILKGSTRYTRFDSDQGGRQLEIKACERNCPHDYDLEIEIVTPEIGGAAVEGGGTIEAANGFPAQDEISGAVDGGGSVDLRAIAADSADAAVNGGGNIKLRAKNHLQAAVDGGGDIRYWGKPQITSAINGGGNVSRGG